MKRITIVLIVALAAAGLGAQPFYGRGPMMGQGFNAPPAVQAEPKTVTIEGKLSFVDSYPALQGKDKTYILRMPRFYYYAYTDNIKEGAALKLEGFELPTFPGQDKPYFAVTKATINGKAYDFAELSQKWGGMGGRGGMMGGRGGMMGGQMGGRGGMMGGRGRW